MVNYFSVQTYRYPSCLPEGYSTFSTSLHFLHRWPPPIISAYATKWYYTPLPLRLGYAVAIIDHLTRSADGRDVKIMYDVACRMRPQLLAANIPMDRVTLAVPVFHGYSHDANCQVGILNTLFSRASSLWSDAYLCMSCFMWCSTFIIGVYCYSFIGFHSISLLIYILSYMCELYSLLSDFIPFLCLSIYYHIIIYVWALFSHRTVTAI